MSATWTTTLKHLFLPQFCKTCEQRLLTDENGYFCPTCWGLARRVSRPFCIRCGKPHQGRAGFGALANFSCGDCESAKTNALERTYGAAYYEGAIADAIKLLKFNGKNRLAEPLGDVMSEFARAEIPLELYDDLVPVPLHPVRHRERGFNQAALLTRQLLPVFADARLNESLRRIRPTRVQSKLDTPQDRQKNVAGAFAVDANTSFDGKTILLIDDVITSGGTVVECARALKRAGARRVHAFAAALALKTPRDMRRFSTMPVREHALF